MIIRNNQTSGALKRLGIFIILIVSLNTLSFRTKDNVENGFPEIFQYGKASYYAGQFIGRKTANGEIFTSQEYTCAHKTLPFGTKLKVTNLTTNESIIVRVNDRGPYVKHRVIDLSLRGAHDLGLLKEGVINVSIEIVNKQFSSLGNTKNMDRIYVDNQFAYVKSNDNDTYDKLYNYLSESLQLVQHKKIEPQSEDKKESLETLKSIDLSNPIITDTVGTSDDKQAFVIEE
jgi:rare lipoprotein A